jgi:hypothetical protein
MPLFTAVLEFDGGTFIAQVKAPSVTKAVAKYVAELVNNDTIGKASIRQRLSQNLSEEKPVAIETVCNVWCCTTSVGSKFALLNIIRTTDN